MRTTGFRSMVLYILLAAFLGGLGYLLYQFVVNGSSGPCSPITATSIRKIPL